MADPNNPAHRVNLTDPLIQAAVAQIVAERAGLIRARARADHADELERAGHDAAAFYLREVPEVPSE